MVRGPGPGPGRGHAGRAFRACRACPDVGDPAEPSESSDPSDHTMADPLRLGRCGLVPAEGSDGPAGPRTRLRGVRGPGAGPHPGHTNKGANNGRRKGFPISRWMWLVVVMMATTVASNHNRPSSSGGQGHTEQVPPPAPAAPVGPPPPGNPRPPPGQLRPPAVDPAEEEDDMSSDSPPGFVDWPVPPRGDNASAKHHDNKTANASAPLFPDDIFTMEQKRNGAIALHILGLVYMFVALAVVCDEFFVPSLDVIIEKLDIADDVAGATFMAAGGSAPELFTSVIGVFVSFDDVGIGTIVGSAVFNILFVIGMCALFSRTVLSLTWWPLFRDCSFYSISLIALIYFFKDNLIYWWEALILFLVYMAYVSFMKWNQNVEKFVKKHLYKNKVTRVRSTDQLMPSHQSAAQTLHANPTTSSTTSVGGGSGAGGSSSGGSGARGGSSSSGPPGTKFRHGLLQLMIHTIDPLHDGKVDEKATQLHAIASLKVLLDATKPHNGAASTSAANHVGALSETRLSVDQPNGILGGPLNDQGAADATRRSTLPSQTELTGLNPGGDTQPDGEDAEQPEALDMAWPDTTRKRITYLLIAPIVFPLWLTLPDTRTPRGKKFFPITFIGSIAWIAAYSYLMVWWANLVGETARIPPEVMGLTFLAAGTSIPDLITSVIVARKGFGDMAVSSSVGSNIFDVTVGLPVPWLLYGIIYGKPVEVNSHGMVCSIAILFMMLLFVILSIACFNWRMNKGLGFTMFLLYFVFVAVSLMFEYKYPYECPF